MQHQVHVGAGAVVLVPLEAALHLEEVVQGDILPPIILPLGNIHGCVDIHKAVTGHNTRKGAGKTLSHAPAKQFGIRADAFVVTLRHHLPFMKGHEGEGMAVVASIVHQCLGDRLQKRHFGRIT